MGYPFDVEPPRAEVGRHEIAYASLGEALDGDVAVFLFLPGGDGFHRQAEGRKPLGRPGHPVARRGEHEAAGGADRGFQPADEVDLLPVFHMEDPVLDVAGQYTLVEEVELDKSGKRLKTRK